MVLVEGEKEVKAFLSTRNQRVNDWLYQVTDAMVFYAAERISQHAPGHISELVGVHLAHETETGAFEATAGVEPDISQENFSGRSSVHGLGSNPADYPVFVEVGTGIFGPVGTPISSIPGHLMGPIHDPFTGRDIFVKVVKGQRPQHYAERSFEELVEHTPVMLKAALPELGSMG